MSFLTLDQARAATPLRGRISLAEAELRKSASARETDTFDVFLSHAREDADVILGVKALLEARRLTVYVDWVNDPQLDRSNVTRETAAVLRGRMKQCRSLIFATSRSSPDSKWMPWELGFFDGYRGRHIAILPLVASPASTFVGQEYLRLYPVIEDISTLSGPLDLGFRLSDGRTRPVAELASSEFWLTT